MKTHLIPETVAQAALLDFLMQREPERLEKRYGIRSAADADLLETLAVKRGMLLKGGVPDLERAAATVLKEFRDGTLGRISLNIRLTSKTNPSKGAKRREPRRFTATRSTTRQLFGRLLSAAGYLAVRLHLSAKAGVEYVIGVDEAGRGCLAGPIFAAAVILASPIGLSEICDSKRLTESQREALGEEIKA